MGLHFPDQGAQFTHLGKKESLGGVAGDWHGCALARMRFLHAGLHQFHLCHMVLEMRDQILEVGADAIPTLDRIHHKQYA